MEFDDLLTNHLGEFGRYQKIIFILISLTAVASAFTTLGIIFVAAVPEHRCDIPRLDALGLDEVELLNLSIPFEYGNDGEKEYSSCKMYDRYVDFFYCIEHIFNTEYFSFYILMNTHVS